MRSASAMVSPACFLRLLLAARLHIIAACGQTPARRIIFGAQVPLLVHV